MRLDLISIFPEFFDVLDLSLIGKAQRDELLELNRIQLRDYTSDRHRTVDDTPTGGGAGMVMKPEPWALALEHILSSSAVAQPAAISQPAAVNQHAAVGNHTTVDNHDAADEQNSVDRQNVADEQSAAEGGVSTSEVRPTLIIPTPSGEMFTQQTAAELAQSPHLVFACGRYEGIDERLTDWASEHFHVRRFSIGDYVLNGGEAAVVVMVEAIARLIPGVIGNAASLEEESHSGDGLLEYPVYSKPSQWRGRAVPEVLLSGDHAKIAAWRREQQQIRTRRIRPDIWARYVVAQERANQ